MRPGPNSPNPNVYLSKIKGKGRDEAMGAKLSPVLQVPEDMPPLRKFKLHFLRLEYSCGWCWWADGL